MTSSSYATDLGVTQSPNSCFGAKVFGYPPVHQTMTTVIDGDALLVGSGLGAPPKYQVVDGDQCITFSHLPLMVVYLQRQDPKWSRHRVYSVLEGVERKTTKALLRGRRIEKIRS